MSLTLRLDNYQFRQRVPRQSPIHMFILGGLLVYGKIIEVH